MNPVEIRWEPDFPADLRPLVEPHLLRWSGLIPTWCQEFIVRYDSKQDGRMATHVNHRNRWAVLIVTPEWFDSPEAERENSMVHELVHVGMEPLTSAVDRIIRDTLEEDTPLRELASSMFVDGMEASVEDMARAIRRTASA